MVWKVTCLLSPAHAAGGVGRQVWDGAKMGGETSEGGEIRSERRMEPADEGEGIYRFASVGKF